MATIGFPTASRTIQRVRSVRKINPVKRSYENLQKLAAHIDTNPETLLNNLEDDDDVILKTKLIKSSSKTFHLAFYDESLVTEFTLNDVFADGTFRIIPDVNGVCQVYKLMGKKHNIVSIDK